MADYDERAASALDAMERALIDEERRRPKVKPVWVPQLSADAALHGAKVSPAKPLPSLDALVSRAVDLVGAMREVVGTTDVLHTRLTGHLYAAPKSVEMPDAPGLLPDLDQTLTELERLVGLARNGLGVVHNVVGGGE